MSNKEWLTAREAMLLPKRKELLISLFSLAIAAAEVAMGWLLCRRTDIALGRLGPWPDGETANGEIGPSSAREPQGEEHTQSSDGGTGNDEMDRPPAREPQEEELTPSPPTYF